MGRMILHVLPQHSLNVFNQLAQRTGTVIHLCVKGQLTEAGVLAKCRTSHTPLSLVSTQAMCWQSREDLGYKH